MLAIVLSLSVCASHVAGQEPKDSAAGSPQPPTVKLGVILTDKKGRTVSDIKREDFRVYEDGVERIVTYFAKEERPVSYGLLVDNSGSLRKLYGALIAGGKYLVSSNRDGDETFLVRFAGNDRIELIRDFTSDKASLAAGLDTMFVEGGQTALIDAVHVSAEHLIKKGRPEDGPARRRVLVLITDGEERGSQRKLEQLIKLIQQSDVQIFCLGLVSELDKERGFILGSPREKAMELLTRLAEESGGRAFFVQKLHELEPVLNEVIAHLHAQYVLGYEPMAPPKNGGVRDVEIKVADAPGRGKLKVITRKGHPSDAGQGIEGGKKKR